MKFEINPKYAHLKEFVVDLPSSFEDVGDTIYKGRNTIKTIRYGDFLLNVKSFKVPHLINKFAYAYIRGSKARHSFEYGMQLTKFGVTTPEPVAYVETFKNGLLDHSFYISIHYSYKFTIWEVIGNDFADKENILRKFTRYTYNKLHKNGVHHLDYSRGNILISPIGDDYEFSVVDINRMRFETMGFKKGLHNFSQLWASADELEVIAREYARINGRDEQKAVDMLLEFDKCHKDKINRKKRWKQRMRNR